MATPAFSKILNSGIQPSPAAMAKVLAAAPSVGAQPSSLSQALAAAPAVQQPAPAPTPAAAAPQQQQTPTVFVNRGDEYGNFNQMGPPGSTLLFASDDPNLTALVAGARSAGYQVGIWIPQGQGPTDPVAYGQYMAQLSNTYHPTEVISNAETLTKQPGWSQAATSSFMQAAPGAHAGLAVESNQTIDYKSWTRLGGPVFAETFTGNSANPLTAQQAQQAQQSVLNQGVPASQLQMLGYRGGTSGSQFAPTPNWFLPAGSVPQEHGAPVPSTPSAPTPPLPAGSIPQEHGNPVTGGPTGPTNPAPAGGATGGGAGAPPLIDFTGDPILARIRAAGVAAVQNATSNAMAAKKQAEIDYGYDPNVAYEDAQTGEAAKANPFSLLANALFGHEQNTRNLGEALNNLNLWYSGEHVRQQGLEDRNYTQAQASGAAALRNALTAANQGVLSAQQNAQNQEISGESDAYNRALQMYLARGTSPAATPASAPASAPAPAPSPASAPAATPAPAMARVPAPATVGASPASLATVLQKAAPVPIPASPFAKILAAPKPISSKTVRAI